MNLSPRKVPTVSIIDTDFKSDSTTQVEAVSFGVHGLSVVVASEHWNARVSFDWVVGFRVLDEGDLCEFWSKCTLADGWLFEVFSGGWKELEQCRPHFVSGHDEKVREFLVAGLNECVSVLSYEVPAISAAQVSNLLVETAECGKLQSAEYLKR